MARTPARVLGFIAVILAFMAFISGLWFLYRYVSGWRVWAIQEVSPWYDLVEISWDFCLPLAVLLITVSVYLSTRGGTEQPVEQPSQPRTSSEAVQVKNEVTPVGASLEGELKKYEEYLAKLEEFRSLGQISEEAYQMLKGEYTAKINELKKKIQAKG
ncbi:MAG: hypothetical protein LM590_13290 [Thermofilum sp.]|jgi:hypothetical protein|nr:hypothetical protein [Thermofilum sp.]